MWWRNAMGLGMVQVALRWEALIAILIGQEVVPGIGVVRKRKVYGLAWQTMALGFMPPLSPRYSGRDSRTSTARPHWIWILRTIWSVGRPCDARLGPGLWR